MPHAWRSRCGISTISSSQQCLSLASLPSQTERPVWMFCVRMFCGQSSAATVKASDAESLPGGAGCLLPCSRSEEQSVAHPRATLMQTVVEPGSLTLSPPVYEVLVWGEGTVLSRYTQLQALIYRLQSAPVRHRNLWGTGLTGPQSHLFKHFGATLDTFGECVLSTDPAVNTCCPKPVKTSSFLLHSTGDWVRNKHK